MADNEPKLYRRNSAGGQALHHWQKNGKHTTIHIVYELERPLSVETLKTAIDAKLLSRFPRFRGHISDDEQRWCVPSNVDPADYVEEVELEASCAAEQATALRVHVEQQMMLPLPPRRSWNVHLIKCGQQCAVLWRVSHTVADGVVLAQIMSRVICEEIKPADDAVVRAATPLPPQPAAEARADAANEQAEDAPTREAEATVLRRRAPRAGPLELLYCFILGVLRVIALPFWTSDTPTLLQLGPYRWKQRLGAALSGSTRTAPHRTAPHPDDPALCATDGCGDAKAGEAWTSADSKAAAPRMCADSAGGAVHAAGAAGVRVALGEPVAISELRAASLAAGVTINDLLMAALGGALRQYLAVKKALPPEAKRQLSLTAVAVINPRPTMPQDMSSEQLLHDYASMRGPGCDITLLLLPLPCGEMGPVRRRLTLAATTRFLKLSPESYLLRLGANLLCRLFGLRCLISLYTIILAKFTLYVSNVVAPPLQGAFCGVPISSIWFGTTPLDFGVSFSFLSYAGANRVCVVTDGATVPDPELMASLVNSQLREQMACAARTTDVPAADVADARE